MARLRNSISHLQQTQTELRSFLEEDEDGDEDGEIGLAIDENEVTMYVPFHASYHPPTRSTSPRYTLAASVKGMEVS